nr:hypothetical protein [Tanacetum cinerariifolium]
IVYATNHGKERQSLWVDLADGSSISKDMYDFHDCTLKKLDRIMVNELFLSTFKKAYAIFLPYIISDHSLIVLVMPNSLDRKPKSFREPHNIAIKEEGVALLKEYKEVILDEGKLLLQKIKIKWLKEGDKNTAYFHKILKSRQHKSRIESIYDEHGIRYEGDIVPHQFAKHFEQFLRKGVKVQSIENRDDIFTCKLNDEEAADMIVGVSNDEIKKAMFYMLILKPQDLMVSLPASLRRLEMWLGMMFVMLSKSSS